jgi:hypothetical protein
MFLYELCYYTRLMRYLIIIVALLSLLTFAAGCTSEIGDDCSADVDCSANMDRNCDTSQPGGYCLVVDCGSDECPGEAVCVEFTTPCPLDMEEEDCQLIEPNRGRRFCLKHCKNSGDCRGKYTCIEPEDLSAIIIDFNTNKSKICVPKSDT